MAADDRLTFAVSPVGVVRSDRSEPIDDDWDAVPCRIVLDATRFGTDAVAGLDAFSHLEVVYLFHLVDPERVHVGSRRPRGREDWPEVGIFAQRGKDRPNRIGVTVCSLVRVEGIDLVVSGLDAIDGTPVLDVKPWMAEFGPRGEVRQPPWSAELMAGYWST